MGEISRMESKKGKRDDDHSSVVTSFEEELLESNDEDDDEVGEDESVNHPDQKSKKSCTLFGGIVGHKDDVDEASVVTFLGRMRMMIRLKRMGRGHQTVP